MKIEIMTQEELTNVFKYIVKKCDMLINNDHYEADAYTQDTVEDIAELCNHILDGKYGKLVEVKEVDLEDEVDKDAYWNLFKDGTKLNIDSTTEINFDETTKFNLYDYIKMKEEEKTNSSKFYKRMFKNIPTVSMKIFSWWNRNKRRENNL